MSGVGVLRESRVQEWTLLGTQVPHAVTGVVAVAESRTLPGSGLRQSITGAVSLSGSSLLLNAISLPVMAYIIRSMGPGEYGEWVTATALVGAVGALAGCGLRPVFVRLVSRDPDAASDAVAHQFGASGVLAAAGALVALCVGLSLGYSRTVLIATAITAMGTVISVVPLTMGDLLQARLQLTRMSAVNFGAGLLLTLSSVVAAWIGVGAIGMSMTYLVGPITSAVLLLLFMRQLAFPIRISLTRTRFRSQLIEARFLAAQNVANVLSAQLAWLMLPKLVGSVSYGMFAAGALLASRLVVIPDSLATALYPLIAREYAVAPVNGARVVVKGLALGLLVCVPIAILAFFLATQIAQVLFPTQAAQCAYVIRMTMWGLPLWSIEFIMRYALTAAGKDALQLRQNVISAAVMTPLTVALVVGWGLAGACWATILTPVVRSLALLPAIVRTFRVAGR